MRGLQSKLVVILLAVFALAPAARCESEQHPTEADRQLIGAWRLVSIEYEGPHGKKDPFYQQASSGIIIYDASGWMSVQIAGPSRAAWPIPSKRLAAPGKYRAAAKAQAYDTYYSYFGTWLYDPTTSSVTHHLASSLIPAESGRSYTQTATLQGTRLIFTVRDRAGGGETVRRKIWEKLSGG